MPSFVRQNSFNFPMTKATYAIFLILVATCWSFTIPCSAQITSAETIEKPALVDIKTPEMTVESIEAKRKKVQDSSALAPEIKTKIDENYTTALANLRKIGDYNAKILEFEKAMANATEILDKLKKNTPNSSQQTKPTIPKDSSLAQLEQLLTQSQAELSTFTASLSEAETILKTFSERRMEIPKLSADAKKRLDGIVQNLATPGQATADTLEMGVSSRTLLNSQKSLTEAEIAFLDKELLTYDSRYEIAKARRDQVQARVSELDSLVKAWQEIVNERRKTEAELAAQKAREALTAAVSANPAVQKLVRENARLAELRTGSNGLAARIEESTKRHEYVSKHLTKVRENFKSIKDRIRATGFTNAIGILLRVKRDEIPAIREFKRSMARRRNNISFVQLQLIEMDEKMASLSNTETAIQVSLAEIDPAGISPEQMKVIKTTIRETIITRKELIQSLTNDYNAYFVKMVDVDSLERQLIGEINTYSAFIDEHILWIQSCLPIRYIDFPRAAKAISQWANPVILKDVAQQTLQNIKANPLTLSLLVLALLTVVILDRRLTKNLIHISEGVSKALTDSFYLTVQATATTAIHALVWPLLLLGVIYTLGSNPEAPEHVKAVVNGLNSLFPVLLILSCVRAIFLPKGLGECHFKWKPQEIITHLRRRLFLMMISCAPIYFIFKTLEGLPRDPSMESLERLVFMLGTAILTLILGSCFRPSGLFFTKLGEYDTSNLIYKLRHVIFLLAGLLPFCLLVMTGLGYFYTSVQMLERAMKTLLLVFGVQLLYAFSYRALNIVKRSMAIRKAQEKKARMEAQKLAEGAEAVISDPSRAVTGENPVSLSALVQIDSEPNIHTMGKQTRKLFLGVAIICTILGLWLIWKDVLPALKALNRVNLWSTTMKDTESFNLSDGTAETRIVEKLVSITLSDLILAITVVFITVTASRNFPGFLEFSIIRRLPFDNGVKFAIRTISSYLISVVGFVIAFHLLGISWDKVQWLVAAVSVGLGFGLQEIFANFISGLIILFERPMRVGDIVTVGDVSGTVARIQIRATTITDWDRKEVIIPNKEFITSRLINWTLSDTILRVIFKVGVAYGSDVDLVQKLLLRVADQNQRILKDPPPKAIFVGFGDSSLDFELRVFIPNMDGWADFLHSVNKAIDDAFRADDVEIPFPQRDLHLRVSDGSLNMNVTPPSFPFMGK